MIKYYITCLVCVLVLCGCGTVRVTSVPEGATIYSRTPARIGGFSGNAIRLSEPKEQGTSPSAFPEDGYGYECIKVVWPDGVASEWDILLGESDFSGNDYSFIFVKSNYVGGLNIDPSKHTSTNLFFTYPANGTCGTEYSLITTSDKDVNAKAFLSPGLYFVKVDYKTSRGSLSLGMWPKTLCLNPGIRTLDVCYDKIDDFAFAVIEYEAIIGEQYTLYCDIADKAARFYIKQDRGDVVVASKIVPRFNGYKKFGRHSSSNTDDLNQYFPSDLDSIKKQ
jgi:hypothetical protein